MSYNKAGNELFTYIELYGKPYVRLWLPQSYNHVVNWNTFSKRHHSSCNFPYLYKLFCLASFGKRKLLLCWLFAKLLTQGGFLSFFGRGFVYKNEKKVLFQCIKVLCVLEGEIYDANDLYSLVCFSSVLKGIHIHILLCANVGDLKPFSVIVWIVNLSRVSSTFSKAVSRTKGKGRSWNAILSPNWTWLHGDCSNQKFESYGTAVLLTGLRIFEKNREEEYQS